MSVTQTRTPRPGRRRRGVLLLHESRALLRIAAPIILAQLGGIGMSTMDTIMVGPLGAGALAGVGLGSSVHMAMLVVTTGTLFGMGPLVSQAFGAGVREECRHVLVQGLWLSAVLSAPMVVLNLYGHGIARALGQAPAVVDVAGDYMWALAWGVPPLLLFSAFRQYLEGMGVTRPAMVITFIGLGVNFLGNSAFIYGVEGWLEPMGAVGSGWATTVVRWAMLLCMAVYLVAHPRLRPFHGVRWAPESAMLGRISAIGFPTGLQVALEVGLFSFAAVMMGWFGALELGTHQVTINIAATTFMVALGVSFAGSIRVGQHVGAGATGAMRRAVLLTYLFAVGFMGLCALVFLVAPEQLLGLYTRDPAIIRLGRSLLLMAALFQIFDGGQVAGFSVLRGAADTRVPMVIAGVAYWLVGVPAAYYLGFHTALGPQGVWAGLVVGLVVATALLLARVRAVLWGARPVSRVVAVPGR